MWVNGVSGLIHAILHAFETAYAEDLTKCLA